MRSSIAAAVTCLSSFVLGSPSPAQAVVDAPKCERVADSPAKVRVRFRLRLPDEAASAGSVWVFASFGASDGSWRDVRWADGGHEVRAVGEASPLRVEPARGGTFIRGVMLGPADDGPLKGAWEVDLIWDLSTSGVEYPDGGFPVRLHAIDMVRIPRGPFRVGEPRGSEEAHAFRGPEGAGFEVTSEDAIEVGDAGLSYASGEYGGDRRGPIPSKFPKGFDEFYVMRRELTEGQYAAFLETLSGRALASRDLTRWSGYAKSGGTIRVTDRGVEVGTPTRAASFVAWADGIAWAAWAGLRPMTELEFEKIARGPDQFGVQDILGGRWERVVSVGTPRGRQFTGTHGPGFVDDLGMPYGFANSDWPGPMALGSGFRGGADGLEDFATAGCRVYAAYDATYGSEHEGFRAVLSLR